MRRIAKHALVDRCKVNPEDYADLVAERLTHRDPALRATAAGALADLGARGAAKADLALSVVLCRKSGNNLRQEQLRKIQVRHRKERIFLVQL